MTPRLARNQIDRVISRVNTGLPIFKKRSVGVRKNLKKVIDGGQVESQSMEATSSDSWIYTFTSWTNVVEMTSSEICDFDDDNFLEDCMRLFSEWTMFEEAEEIEEEEEEMVDEPVVQDSLSTLVAKLIATMIADAFEQEAANEMDPPNSVVTASNSTVSLPSGWDAVSARLSTSSIFHLFSDRVVTPIPSLFSIDPTGEEDEEVIVEPETHDRLMAALLSTKELLPSPSVDIMRALSCPDLLMDSLAVLLYETRHLHFLNERLALPPPPKWMVTMEAEREMDPPNSLVSTVSLPSGWDDVSARLSTSSIFNLFSDRVATPVPSLFSIDPTGIPSTASTVSVPLSFWDTPSTVSVTGSEPTVPLKPISSTTASKRVRFNLSSTSSASTDSSSSWPSSSSSSSSSLSSLFMDPSSAHSISSCSSSLLPSLSSSSVSICRCHWDDDESSSEDDDDLFSGSSTSDYETDVDSEPVLKKMTTVSATTQTEVLQQSSAARMLAECDSMLAKLMEMKKKLRELL